MLNIYMPQCLERNGLGELVLPRCSAHSDPKGERVGSELLLGGTSGGRRGRGNSDRNGGAALVATCGIDVDSVDTLAVGSEGPCQAWSALVTCLAADEGLGNVIMLEGLDWPCSAIWCQTFAVKNQLGQYTYSRTNSVTTVSTQVISSEYLPRLPATVVVGTSLTRMLA